MKSLENLLKLAAKLQNKYALDASSIKEEIKEVLQQQIANASTSPTSGIMPFVSMLRQDKATLAINVNRSGDHIKVSSPTVTPDSVADKYAELPRQIKRYLEKNIEIFPTKFREDSVDYHNLTITLNY